MMDVDQICRFWPLRYHIGLLSVEADIQISAWYLGMWLSTSVLSYFQRLKREKNKTWFPRAPSRFQIMYFAAWIYLLMVQNTKMRWHLPSCSSCLWLQARNIDWWGFPTVYFVILSPVSWSWEYVVTRWQWRFLAFSIALVIFSLQGCGCSRLCYSWRCSRRPTAFQEHAPAALIMTS